jgi:hypothetical protein
VHLGKTKPGAAAVDLGGDVTFQSKVFFDDQNDAPSFILDKTAINGRTDLPASWMSPNDVWQISAWGKTVTGQHNLIVASDLTPFYTNLAEFGAGKKMSASDWNSGATFGGTVTFKM